ncbi:MAG: DUF2911 domain-containing protein [Bacteroidota bacterium]
MNHLRPILLVLLSIVITGSLVSCQQSSDAPQPEPGQESAMTEEQQMTSDQPQEPDSESGEDAPLSPDRTAMANVGDTHVHMEYSAPSVRDREIWGNLVAYDEVWSTGAHMATSVEFANDMVIAGETVPAGKYAFFTIPGRESWTVILNENWDQHLADDYDPELDVLRFEVTPEEHEFTEQLKFEILGTPEGDGFIELTWEEIQLRIPISEAGVNS